MLKFKFFLLASLLISQSVLAEQECKVSMMGRVCYEAGTTLEIASHMKSNSNSVKVVSDAEDLKLSDKNKEIKLVSKQKND